MNRRKFIKNSALAATLVGVSPNLSTAFNKPVSHKKIIFVFRGVAYADAFNAFQKVNPSGLSGSHIQKITCSNSSYTHTEGMDQLLKGLGKNHEVMESQLQEKFSIAQIVEDAFSVNHKKTPVYHLHHTEIGHSSNKLYTEKLEEFFTELLKHYKEGHHQVIVTADIGRNANNNSCGGKDHSNATCLETFALFIGGNTAQLAAHTGPLPQENILIQKF